MSSKKVSPQTSNEMQPAISVKPKEQRYSIERIESFLITTDSVVAKATVVTSGETRSLEIDWGDGELDTLNLNDLNRVAAVSPIPNPDPLPPNTYEFYHQYAVSYIDVREQLFPKAEEYLVTLFARESNGEFDFKAKPITIRPKYKINFYGLTVGNKNQCDGGGSNEFSTTQTVGGEVRNQWDWTSSNDFLFTIPTHYLDGSQLALVFEVTEISGSPQPNIDAVKFSFTEEDRWYSETGSVSYPKNLPFYRKDMEEYASGRLEGSFQIRDSSFFGFSCTLLYGVGWEIKLLAPIPTYTWPVAIA